MDIIYLKKLQENPILPKSKFELEGMSISEIEVLEAELNDGNPFPRAFREFLFLAGKFDYLLRYDRYDYAKMQEDARKELVAIGANIRRPFFVTDQLDGCEQFGFFFTDDPKDDPTFYYAHPAYVEDGLPLYRQNKPNSFGQLINALLEKTLKYDKLYTGK